jgi:hypothetical protein
MSKNSADERRSARANVLLAAVIERDGVCTPVRVGNVSAHGALVLCDDLPLEERVTFRCNGLAIDSWIAWVRPPFSGIQFGEPIRAEELLRTARAPRHLITQDSRKVDHRRPGFRGQQLNDDERQIVAEWKASQ